MDLQKTVCALEALCGQHVQVEVWGIDKGGAPIAFLDGELRRMGEIEHSPAFADIVGESAEIFLIGDGHVSVGPDRFISAKPMPNSRGWFELRTRDVTLRIGPRRVPWAD